MWNSSYGVWKLIGLLHGIFVAIYKGRMRIEACLVYKPGTSEQVLLISLHLERPCRVCGQLSFACIEIAPPPPPKTNHTQTPGVPNEINSSKLKARSGIVAVAIINWGSEQLS
jgi:hypothetical protein